VQVLAGKGIPIKGISLRHLMEAAKDALLLSVNIQNNMIVTWPGWQGCHISKPLKVFTKGMLQEAFSMHYFNWNGL